MGRLRSAIALLLFHAGRIADRISRAAVYLGAGTRRLEEMQADNTRAWDDFYQTHPSHDARLLPWEEEFVGTFVQPRAEVLLVGCGSGRDLLPLLERNCQVTGIDPSGKALAMAQRLLAGSGLSATLIQGYFEDVPIAQTFDVVIFSYYCYGTIPMASRRITTLKKAGAILKPRGAVIVSHPVTMARPRSVLVRLGKVAGSITRSDWRLEAGDFISDNRDRLPSFSYSHAFEEGELEREAAAAGLGTVFRRISDDNTVVAAFERT